MPRKLCRAVACPREIGPTELFCSVHLGVMPQKTLQPIANNREPSGSAEDVRRVRAAVDDAVTQIARLEGRAEGLRLAKTRGTIDVAQSSPVTGQDTGINPGGGGGGSGGRTFTDRYIDER